MIVVLFVVSILVFMLTHSIGDPRHVGAENNSGAGESARQGWGLYKPFPYSMVFS